MLRAVVPAMLLQSSRKAAVVDQVHVLKSRSSRRDCLGSAVTAASKARGGGAGCKRVLTDCVNKVGSTMRVARGAGGLAHASFHLALDDAYPDGVGTP